MELTCNFIRVYIVYHRESFMDHHPTCTAFANGAFFTFGPPWEVALTVKAALERGETADILTFDDATGRLVDFDFRGSDEDLVARLRPPGGDGAKARGRPKLGVVAREVTLLPRHWEWLGSQPGGASVTLRKLVDAARAANDGRDAIRQAQQAADRFMAAMLGNQPGYEDASRALYAGDAARFEAMTQPWPADLRDHARRLASAAFAPEAEERRG
jgi:uncharacterized protein